MKLLIQPGDGIQPLLNGIDRAKTSIHIAIFRMDRSEIERALGNAVKRGVAVTALIAHMNHSGQAALRKLELRLLAAGITVARTADDLVRYHGKLMVIDRKVLYLLAFNFTYLDMEQSRSFAIITSDDTLVHEAVKLFDADIQRHPYQPGSAFFIVSPVNAREELSAFLAGAKKSLKIYDPTVSDPAMIRILSQRAEAGVEVQILGRLSHKTIKLSARKMTGIRLHTRSIVRDGVDVFIGSQSLRALELDGRREVGVIVHDRRLAARIAKVFEDDWGQTSEPKEDVAPTEKVAKKMAKAVTKQLPPLVPVLEGIIKEMGHTEAEVELVRDEVEETMKGAVKEAIREAVRDVLETETEKAPVAPEL